MKQKLITFLIGFLIYGTLFGVIIFFAEGNTNSIRTIISAIIFGISMGLFEVFINPRVKKYFTQKRKK